MHFINEAILFLIAAVITVPIFKRLGLGSILGYLAAGIMLGPSGLRLFNEVEDILSVAELGVVLLLFVIGLELKPARLWLLRKSLIGFGSAQVFITLLALSVLAYGFGLDWKTAVVIGACLSLSSTAFALQMLTEKNQLLAQYGRTAFSILLFQDLIVIPILALLPLLAMPEGFVLDGEEWLAIGKAVGAFVVVIIGGHFLIRPLLQLVARTNNKELFVAASLLVALGAAAFMQLAGLSMALGAFMAGALLADSEFRHELEANIEPFKGLLLGLFFISVGMSVDLGLIAQAPGLILSITFVLVFIKAAVLFGIAITNQHSRNSAIKLAIVLSQGGEFAFVILHEALQLDIVAEPVANFIIVTVTLSMALTPLLFAAYERFVAKQKPLAEPEPEYDAIDDQPPRIIIAGFGRFGQIIARILRIKRIPFTALEANFQQVEFVRRFGNKIYFGDASRLDLLTAAGAEHATIFVLAIVHPETSIKIASTVKQHFPNLKIYARARNRQHAYRLLDSGADYVMRETVLSSIALAKKTLVGAGVAEDEANKVTATFRDYDEALLHKQYAIHHDEDQVMSMSKQAALELQGLFEEDTAR